MNKIIATAALSLTLVACSDNSSLTGSSQFTGAQKQVRNLSAQCIYGIHADAAENDLINSNENLSVTESGTIDRDKNISKIYPANSEGFALVTIENIDLTCSSDIVGVDVVAEGDTLFVDAKIESDEIPLDCLCPRKVSFEVKYDSTFENVKYTKYEGYRIIPLQKVVPEDLSNEVVPENPSNEVLPDSAEQHVSKVDSTEENLNSSREVKMYFTGCYEDLSKKATLLKESAEDLPLAYLYNEDGKYRLMIPKLADYCGFEKVMMDVARSGDTLRIDVKAMIPTACRCVNDHWFDIEARDADIKYFAHTPYQKKETMYKVVPGPAPEGL